MRTILLSSVIAAAASLVAIAPASAQGNPSADQIMRALRPASGGIPSTTRGIRPAAPTTAAPADQAARPPAAVAPASGPGVAAPAAQSATAGAPVRPAAPPPAAVAPSIDLTVQFRSGSADLTPAAMQVLDRLGQALTSPDLAAYRFRIEGHTDTVGTAASNMTLSQQRAARVADYLERKFGVAAARLEPVGRGQDALKVATPDQTDEPRNRRVQVINIGA